MPRNPQKTEFRSFVGFVRGRVPTSAIARGHIPQPNTLYETYETYETNNINKIDYSFVGNRGWFRSNRDAGAMA